MLPARLKILSSCFCGNVRVLKMRWKEPVLETRVYYFQVLVSAPPMLLNNSHLPFLQSTLQTDEEISDSLLFLRQWQAR